MSTTTTPGTQFVEHHVEADGFRVRYLTAGSGEPLVMLHGAGGIELNPAHDLLAREFHVHVVEMPGFGDEANTRTSTLAELADTVAATASVIGLDTWPPGVE